MYIYKCMICAILWVYMVCMYKMPKERELQSWLQNGLSRGWKSESTRVSFSFWQRRAVLSSDAPRRAYVHACTHIHRFTQALTHMKREREQRQRDIPGFLITYQQLPFLLIPNVILS